MLNRNDRVMHWTAAKACLIKRGPCIFCFFYSRISHFQLISQLSCKMWHLTQRQSTKRTKANKTGCSDNKGNVNETRRKRSDVKWNAFSNYTKNVEIVQGLKNSAWKILQRWTNDGQVKDGIDKMGTDTKKGSMLLVIGSCRQGPHRTLSPSVSCTALGSAARLALPLAWAICRYMDV